MHDWLIGFTWQRGDAARQPSRLVANCAEHDGVQLLATQLHALVALQAAGVVAVQVVEHCPFVESHVHVFESVVQLDDEPADAQEPMHLLPSH
jgi:hypothetical protein